MATTATIVDFLLTQQRDSSTSLAGGTVTFYSAGTTSLKTIWTDSIKASEAANPYTLDARGAAVLYGDGNYKVVLKDSDGTTIATWDNVYIGSDLSSIDLSAVIAAASFTNRDYIGNSRWNIWNGGTSFTRTTTVDTPTADGWYLSADGSAAGSVTISRQTFTVGQSDVPGNPTYYARVNRTVAHTGATYEYYAFRLPIETAAGTQMTLSGYAKCAAPVDAAGVCKQYFGSGGSASVTTTTAAVTLTTGWVKYSVTFTVPSIAGKTVGSGSYVEIGVSLPINTTYTVDFAQFKWEAGTVASDPEYRTVYEDDFRTSGKIATTNYFTFADAAGGVNEKYWKMSMDYSSNTWTLAALDDSQTNPANVFTVTRSGNSIVSVELEDVPLPAASDDSTKIASTAFVQDAVALYSQPVDTDLTALAGLSTTGLIARTGSGTASARTITAPAAGITISNGDGVSGNPTLALANDLAAYEGLSSTGIVTRTGDGTATTRTITAGTGCSVTNGDGVSGNPTVSVTPGVGLGDVLSAETSSSDGQITLFSGTGGKTIKKGTTTGILKASSGVVTAAVSGTDYCPATTGSSILKASSGGTAAAVSGTDIKTINSTSILGSGDIAIPNGISTVGTTITTDATLTSASEGYQPVAMTAMGKSVTLPDATTMTEGGPRFIIKNNGGYPFGIRSNGGLLVGAVAASGIAYVTLEDNSTAAGTWSVVGDNLEPGLITIDNTFSSTYASTVLKPYVALDDNKSIHFVALASGFAAVAVDNTTKVVGTPVTVDATASSVPKHCFKISATTAIVFYGATNDTLYGVVLTLSGATTLAVGTATNSGANTGIAVEDFSGAPKIAQISTSLYLVSWATATGAGNTSVMAIGVSGTTVTFGAKADIIAANNVANSTTTYALTATTGLVLYLNDAASPYTISAVVVSVSGTTCTVGTPASIADIHSVTTSPPFSCLLSATKALVVANNNNANLYVYAITVSGTTVTFGATLNVEALSGANLHYTGGSATRYNPHLWRLSDTTAGLWYLDGSGISRVVVLSESGGTVTKGTILYSSVALASSGTAGSGTILPQGTTDFISVSQEAGTITSGIGARGLSLVPHKISGTNITSGSARFSPDILNVNPDSIFASLLSTGMYVIGLGTGGSTNVGASAVKVVDTNGDFIEDRGSISLPTISITAYPFHTVSSNRIVFIGLGGRGTTVGASTYQLRLLNVEVCA